MKNWQMLVIFGGAVGLCIVPVLDVLVYFAPVWNQTPESLIETLSRFALLGLILKYWFVVLGFVALIGWFRDLSERDRAI